MTDGYHIRRTAVDYSVGLITNVKCAVLLVASLTKVCFTNAMFVHTLTWFFR
jgi:hypothetical protein